MQTIRILTMGTKGRRVTVTSFPFSYKQLDQCIARVEQYRAERNSVYIIEIR